MKPLSFMLIAGEASGDAITAELVKVLATMPPQASETEDVQPLYASLQPRFFGAGGPKMAQAGVELAFDMTGASVIGFSDAFKKLALFRRMFYQLLDMAADRLPDVIILVDFGGFNLRFARAIRKLVRSRSGIFNNWNPKIVQYVSPQVWASREGRAAKMAKDIDLLLSIIPFEKDWYAKRVPNFPVEYVGHPICDRHAHSAPPKALSGPQPVGEPVVVLLPGSRNAELSRHLPVIIEAAKQIGAKQKVRFKMVLSNEDLAAQARQFDLASIPNLTIQIGNLKESLSEATVAISKTGTVILECAFFGVPTVTLYKTSWSTYQIGRRIVKVRFLGMPNILADEAVYPELVQNDASPENIARETLNLLTNPSRRQEFQAKLQIVIDSLGASGAAQRAGEAIMRLVH